MLAPSFEQSRRIFRKKMREHSSVENIWRKQKTHKLPEEEVNEERDSSGQERRMPWWHF